MPRNTSWTLTSLNSPSACSPISWTHWIQSHQAGLLVDVLWCCSSALHYSTWSQRGSDIGFSSCTVPNYLILVSKYFRCVPGTLRILEVLEVVWEFRSKSGMGT